MFVRTKYKIIDTTKPIIAMRKQAAAKYIIQDNKLYLNLGTHKHYIDDVIITSENIMECILDTDKLDYMYDLHNLNNKTLYRIKALYKPDYPSIIQDDYVHLELNTFYIILAEFIEDKIILHDSPDTVENLIMNFKRNKKLC